MLTNAPSRKLNLTTKVHYVMISSITAFEESIRCAISVSNIRPDAQWLQLVNFPDKASRYLSIHKTLANKNYPKYMTQATHSPFSSSIFFSADNSMTSFRLFLFFNHPLVYGSCWLLNHLPPLARRLTLLILLSL